MSDTPAPTTGSSGSIRRSSSRKPRKKRINQIPFGLAALAVIIIGVILLAGGSPLLAFFWLTGNIFGFILQKTRFCFTASMRDPYLTGGTTLTKAVLAALAIFTFTAIWSDFMMPLIVMHDESMYTLPLALANLSGQHTARWGILMSGAVVTILPITIAFLILR